MQYLKTPQQDDNILVQEIKRFNSLEHKYKHVIPPDFNKIFKR